LPAPLAAALADADLDAADRAVVVVAIELAGYDTSAGAAPVTELLDALIGVAVDQCGATLIEASPTALRLLFGAPTSAGAEFDAHAAVTAATRLVREMDHRRGQQPAWAMVRLRVGVHAGSALVGLLGPARRLEYRAVGPAVDGAVAAMNASFPGRVLATGAVVAELAGRFEAVPEPALLPDGPGFWIGTGA
jgi:class 3 adenylate cyclase